MDDNEVAHEGLWLLLVDGAPRLLFKGNNLKSTRVLQLILPSDGVSPVRSKCEIDLPENVVAHFAMRYKTERF